MACLPRFDLQGKAVLITGASGGLGAEMANACVQAGADVVLAGRDMARLAEVAAGLEGSRRCECLSFDLRDVASIRSAVAEAFDRMGTIDGLVNNAGVNRYRLALEVSEDEYDWIMDVNLKATFFMSQSVAREWVARGRRGRIVNVASTSGLRGADYRSVDGAAKGGVVNLTRALAVEWGPLGIAVNCIAPTFTPTDLNREMLADPQRRAEILRAIPAGRLGVPMDHAAAVVFLLSEAADFINGVILPVDGGRLAL